MQTRSHSSSLQEQASQDQASAVELPEPSDLENGLTIERVFSREDEHPFDGLEWERRDAAIKNPDGDIVFEQKDVEFPKQFSQLATNVVASKYFYGDLDDRDKAPDNGGREDSLKQLVHRVTRTITDWGKEQDYFATEEDAETFYDELTWLCVNQYGAFNSPVWFNVGLNQQYGITDTGDTKISGWDFEKEKVVDVDPYEYPQASACFIISVEDSIDDIWNLMGESARLFKFGSGVGADWSTLRSSKEKLSGGGTPSGPVSFMKVQDETGSTIKSGGKTRRAAIMQTLKSWHPDIMEFVEAKQEEEKKAWALIEQGYDGSFNGPAYGSVAFQNVNQSVRVTDEFMKAAEQGTKYPLRAVLSGETIEKVDAAKILEKVAEGTYVCGDPGLQFEDTIQRWHTSKASGPINSSNPCVEFLYLDDTSCNLASLNLRKYQREDASVDVERLRAAARIFITAQEILVDNAGYPSCDIARNSHDFRPLGLGFANLGAMLMAMGLPYDSNLGRSVAGAVVALIHHTANIRSAEIAANKHIGPFPGYKANEEDLLNVLRMHRRSTVLLAEEGDVLGAGEALRRVATPKNEQPGWVQDLWEEARRAASDAVDCAVSYGVRNAQVTVSAPTGTISFYMDCDTTGIEPDIALVKYKLLAGEGEGMFKIVNRTVPLALKRLGYDEDERMAIIEYIDEHDTIEGAPVLKDEHLPVFDCAFKPAGGERSIHHMGHIRMMAACQPFLSGGISKTCNVPEPTSIEEIAEIYVEAWKLGLKAVAIYRENSKRSQPLSTSEGGNTQKSDKEKAADPQGDGAPQGCDPQGAPVTESEPEIQEKVVYKPTRKRLPDERPSITHKFSIAGHEGYLTVGLYPETRKPGEIFITIAKQGSTLAGMMDAFATSVSIALQYGVPLEDLCRKFSHMRFEPSGFTNNKQIPIAKSMMDYIFRYLAIKFLDKDVATADTEDVEATMDPNQAAAEEADRSGPAADASQGELDFGSMDEPTDDANSELIGQTVEAFMTSTTASEEQAEQVKQEAQQTYKNQSDAPPCPDCGSITVRNGSCYRCPNCGASTGCG